MGNKYGQGLSLTNLGLVTMREGDFARAAVLYREGLRLFLEIEEKIFAVRCLEEIAWLACLRGEFAQAACLLGAAEAQREFFVAALTPAARGEHDHFEFIARSGLDASAFAAAWAEGRALTLTQAVTRAMSLGG
jgi:hypothetical protein